MRQLNVNKGRRYYNKARNNNENQAMNEASKMTTEALIKTYEYVAKEQPKGSDKIRKWVEYELEDRDQHSFDLWKQNPEASLRTCFLKE